MEVIIMEKSINEENNPYEGDLMSDPKLLKRFDRIEKILGLIVNKLEIELPEDLKTVPKDLKIKEKKEENV